jgi:hypothetical protein
MNDPSGAQPVDAFTAVPVQVDVNDRQTRRRAALAAGRAYVGHPLWWLVLVVFVGIGSWTAIGAWDAYRGHLSAQIVGFGTALALVCVVAGIVLVPVVIAGTIYRAKTLYYLDIGIARAAMATKPDSRAGALEGDIHAHTLGAFPKHKEAGGQLARWVRDCVHADGGRITGTALPGLARKYIENEMVDDGRTAGFLIRVASKARTELP